MLIDDSSIDNFVNQKIIERYGFSGNVIVYSRAKKALEYLIGLEDADRAAFPALFPDVIFLDLNMPVMNGHEFLEEYARLSSKVRSNCRVVVLSSTVNPADVSLSMRNSNVFAFFSKPLLKTNLETLAASIARAEPVLS